MIWKRQILIYRGGGTPPPLRGTSPLASRRRGGFWQTCRGYRGRQRPDLQSYAAACTPRAGPFLRQGACDQSKKGFLADFAARRFGPVYTLFSCLHKQAQNSSKICQRGFERPENSPVDCFQRERDGSPLEVLAGKAVPPPNGRKPATNQNLYTTEQLRYLLGVRQEVG